MSQITFGDTIYFNYLRHNSLTDFVVEAVVESLGGTIIDNEWDIIEAGIKWLKRHLLVSATNYRLWQWPTHILQATFFRYCCPSNQEWLCEVVGCEQNETRTRNKYQWSKHVFGLKQSPSTDTSTDISTDVSLFYHRMELSSPVNG